MSALGSRCRDRFNEPGDKDLRRSQEKRESPVSLAFQLQEKIWIEM
jgi:hypothetical protein